MLKSTVKNLINGLNGDASVIIKNINTGETISINDNMVFPSASIIKLPILWELFKKIDSKKISLDSKIILKDIHKVEGFGILKELHEGLNLSIEDIATLMIILSDNVATNILIDLLGIDTINNSIKEIGLTETVLQRKMMDLEAKKKGFDNFTSSRDVAKLLENFMQSEDLSSISKFKIINILKKQQCNNKLPILIDGKIEFAHKTGDLPNLEHDAGILFLKNKSIIIVVLTKNLGSNELGIKFNNNIGKIAYDYFK